MCVVSVVLIYSYNVCYLDVINRQLSEVCSNHSHRVSKGEGGGGELLWYWNWRYHTQCNTCCFLIAAL